MSGFDGNRTALVTLENGEAAAVALAAARAGEALILRLMQVPGMTARSGAQPGERIVISHGSALIGSSEVPQMLRAAGMRSVVLTGAPAAQLARMAAEIKGLDLDPVLLPEPEEAAALSGLMQGLFPDETPVILQPSDVARLWVGDTSRRGWRAEIKAERYLGTLEERLDPARTAYILVDVQNDFCRAKRVESDTFGIIDAALPNIARLLDSARIAGCTVVHVKAEYGPLFRSVGHPYRLPGARQGEIVWTYSASEFSCNGPQLPDDQTEVCREGTWGEECTEVSPIEGEIVLRKHRYSAFVDTGLEALLRAKGIETVVIVGVATNVCVESTARDASMRDFYTVVVEDGVGVRDAGRPAHDAALSGLRACFAMVTPAARIDAIWRSSSREAAE